MDEIFDAELQEKAWKDMKEKLAKDAEIAEWEDEREEDLRPE